MGRCRFTYMLARSNTARMHVIAMLFTTHVVPKYRASRLTNCVSIKESRPLEGEVPRTGLARSEGTPGSQQRHQQQQRGNRQ